MVFQQLTQVNLYFLYIPPPHQGLTVYEVSVSSGSYQLSIFSTAFLNRSPVEMDASQVGWVKSHRGLRQFPPLSLGWDGASNSALNAPQGAVDGQSGF